MTIFDANNIQRHIDSTMASIPEGDSGALVGYYSGNILRFSIAQRLGNGKWSLGATFERDNARGKITGWVGVRGSWK